MSNDGETVAKQPANMYRWEWIGLRSMFVAATLSDNIVWLGGAADGKDTRGDDSNCE
jgi:hypothetical protein